MNDLRAAGEFLRWLLRTAIMLVVALLLLRALVEYLPDIAAIPPVRAIVGWWDPVLADLAQAAGLPWSRDVRGLALPALAVALILLRTLADDSLRRLTTRPQSPPAAAPPVVPAEDPAATMLEARAAAPAVAAPVRTATGTGFFPAPAAAPAATALRIGRYEILAELGHGAMGVVYKALDPRIGRTVAIKTISAAGAGQDLEQYRARFLVEAKSAGRLNHPGVVSVYDVTEDEAGRPCLVLEFVEGETLDRLMGTSPLPLAQALDIVAQVARALEYAHRNGIVHRDVKPANIMLTAEGQAKLSDFGIAKLEGTSMTVAGQVLGTPAFMSPEQCNGAPLDHRSDIFSLGTVLYTLATGQKPFAGETFTAVAVQVAHEQPTPAHQINPGVPAALDGILARCMAKSPFERYASAGALAADLDQLRATLAPAPKDAVLEGRPAA